MAETGRSREDHPPIDESILRASIEFHAPTAVDFVFRCAAYELLELRGERPLLMTALHAAHRAFKADRESRSSDAMHLAEKAWPLIEQALKGEV